MTQTVQRNDCLIPDCCYETAFFLVTPHSVQVSLVSTCRTIKRVQLVVKSRNGQDNKGVLAGIFASLIDYSRLKGVFTVHWSGLLLPSVHIICDGFPPQLQVLSHNLCTVMRIPHDPVALEEHFKDDDEGPVSNQGYMPYLNKFILDKVSQHC